VFQVSHECDRISPYLAVNDICACYAGKTSAFKVLRSALCAALKFYNDVAIEKGCQNPLDLLGDSSAMEDLLQKLSQTFGNEQIFLEDEGNRKLQDVAMYEQGMPAMSVSQKQQSSTLQFALSSVTSWCKV
jgi:hypothetical protein